MVKCNWCDQEMTDDNTTSCFGNAMIDFGEFVMEPIPYHADNDFRCHDCNIANGGYHHPGCDMERCPNCGRQLISCGCLNE